MDRERLLRLLADACLARDGRAKLADLEALLDEHGITGADREELLGKSGARLGVYRALVRNTVGTTAFRLLPRTRRSVNAAADDAFDDGVVDFLHEAGPRSPLLRDLVFELADFLRARWAGDARLPAWAPEILDFETTRFATEIAEGPAPVDAVPALDPNTRFALAAGATLRAYAFAVHEVDEDGTGEGAPRAAATKLAFSRNANDEVHVTALDAFAFDVVHRLAEGATLGAAVTEATTSAPAAPDAHAARTQALASALAELARLGFFAAA